MHGAVLRSDGNRDLLRVSGAGVSTTSREVSSGLRNDKIQPRTQIVMSADVPAGSSRHSGMVRGIRWVAAAVVGAAAATSLTGCGAGSWCSPLEPGPSVTAEYAPTAERLEALPGVTRVTERYWQPDDSHCVSREYLKTAAWSADFSVRVRAGFTLEQVRAVRAALRSSTATVTSAAGAHLAAWELKLANSSGATPAPSAAPLLVDEQGYRLVTEAAALPDVTIAVHSSVTSIRVRTPTSVPAAVAWLRERPSDGSATVYVGTVTTWSMSVSATGTSAVSDATVRTATAVLAAHRDIHHLSVSGSGVTAVVPSKRQAQQVVTAFEQTPQDQSGQRVSVWWPNGNGTEVSGVVGSAR